jgi:hypothetical protein
VTFDEFTAGIDMFTDLVDINQFFFVVRIPPVDFLTATDVRNDVLREMYSQTRTVLKQAGLFYDEQIKLRSTDDDVRVVYEDDTYDFQILADKGRVSVERKGSSLSTFHDWYAKVMPYSQVITQGIRTVIGEKTKQTVDPLSVSFSYRFLLHDFTRIGGTREPRADRPRVKNVEVLKALLGRVPAETGRLVDHVGTEANLNRVDVSISRTAEVNGRKRSFWFKVEAPANKMWKALYFDLAYVAGSFTSPGGMRESFDETSCDEWDVAYTEFLRKVGIGGFMASLLDGYDFRSSSGDLP